MCTAFDIYSSMLKLVVVGPWVTAFDCLMSRHLSKAGHLRGLALNTFTVIFIFIIFQFIILSLTSNSVYINLHLLVKQHHLPLNAAGCISAHKVCEFLPPPHPASTIALTSAMNVTKTSCVSLAGLMEHCINDMLGNSNHVLQDTAICEACGGLNCQQHWLSDR